MAIPPDELLYLADQDTHEAIAIGKRHSSDWSAVVDRADAGRWARGRQRLGLIRNPRPVRDLHKNGYRFDVQPIQSIVNVPVTVGALPDRHELVKWLLDRDVPDLDRDA